MTRALGPALLAVLLVSGGVAQFPPDLGPVSEAVDEVAGTVIPPALSTVYNATGQNITREDVRLSADLNITKGDVGAGGFLIGSGNIELQADVKVRGEMRVISTERIRAAIEGDNAYNLSAENATFLSEAYLPAEVFRATLTAEAIAAFQEEMEQGLRDFIARTVPEMNVLSLDITWSNTSPVKTFSDTSLTEPPIVVELDATIQYVRVESVGSLLDAYLAGRDSGTAKKDHIAELKGENSDPLRTREFFSAAAYNQLLNLSMQPGWTLDIGMSVPHGYSFEYTNEEVQRESTRAISFEVDGEEASEEDPKVFIASITHRRAVALVMLLAIVVLSQLVLLPTGIVYRRLRVGRHDR